MGGACSRNSRQVLLSAPPAQQSSTSSEKGGLCPAGVNLSWAARGIRIDAPLPPLDTLLFLSLRAIRTSLQAYSSFEQLPPDLSQRVFDALVADSSLDKEVLKKFRGCFLRDVNLGTTPGVDDTWVDDILAAGCGYIEILSLANSFISTPALQRIVAVEKSIRSLNLGRCKSLTAEAFKTIGGLVKMQELVLEGNTQINKSVLESLSGLERLTKMDVSCSPNVTGGLACLTGLKNLEELQLSRTDITDAGLVSLSGLERLKVLDLGGCKITDVGIVSIRSLTGLTDLRVENCPKVGDVGLRVIAGNWNLRRLNCSYTGATDAGVAALAAIPGLSALSLDSCPVTDASLAHIGQMRTLTELDLSDTAVCDAGMAHLRQLAALTSLNISYSAVSDAGLRALRTLPNLKLLNLDSRLITDIGLANLGPMPNLEELDLFGAIISDAGAAVIARQFRLLKVLEICGGGLTDAGVAQLAQIPTLKCLSIAQNRGVTDMSVPHIIRGLKKLSCLNLTHCRVTSSGATQLVKLRELRSLTLHDCKVSKVAVDTIRTQCPHAVILSSH